MTRMSITNTPKTATIDDASLIGRTLARAFDDDPMMRWFFPDDTTREAGLGRYFTTIFARQYVHHGVCEHTEAAAAFWVPPGAQDKAVPDAETIQELAEILGDRAPLFQQAAAAAAGHGPQEPHWYLAVVGADPAAQGQGHGAALLRSGLAKADAAGLPAYLESSKPSNLPFYEHFGFTVLGEVQLPGGGPTLWSMRREPRRPADV
ncbi:GNAT family N-acetyltransferase [Streptomyces inhibens]|uniref:GNAT family N-acetyltransferase n=1 Tax=Streptomyces inhibens TaxID=2293571 RepID=UPI001EE6D2FE|nr:GNAT family N-acetyltransferase [Streptomyces inhibens]UKY54653.1 GNAT family N-acetyltransferase [Streptomyces inhibens]